MDDALEHEKRRLAALGPISAQRCQGNSYLLNMQSRIDTVILGDYVPLKHHMRIALRVSHYARTNVREQSWVFRPQS